ncbi:dockerin type I domain-containing protein [Halorubrum kocurii]|uniref:dockerin type I domain-containing protein n=1 Tax=Halorubrum kocurii TaxID=478441 RepID=UPI001269803B|nr:dockerin type I domain-containing protein [Halorubrum kocurii]
MYTKQLSVVVVIAMLTLSIGATGALAGEGPDGGFLPNDDTVEPASNSDNVETANHPTGDWNLLIDDDQTSDEPELGVDKVYAQHTPDTLYFKTEFHGDFSAHDDIDLAYFLDTDQNRATGLNNDTEDWYYMADIGADYAAVAGLEGDGVWSWTGTTWDENSEALAYADFDYRADTVIIGIDRADIDNPDSIDILVANAMTSPWDYAPDRSEGSVTYDFSSSDDDGNENSAGAVTSLSPSESTVPVGSTTTVEVVVNNTGEIAVYDFDVSLNDTSSAVITDITLKGDPGVQNVNITDRSSASARAAVAEVSGDGGAVIAEVELGAARAGVATLETTVNSLGDDEGVKYNITDPTASATVRSQTPPGDITGDGNPATDPDGDGVYEDVNGDGSVNALDVQALFANLNSDSVQGNMAFDFNGDGSVSVIDVQYMFAQL